MINRIGICAAAAVVILAGCSSFDGQKVRQEHVDGYRRMLDQQAEKGFRPRLH